MNASPHDPNALDRIGRRLGSRVSSSVPIKAAEELIELATSGGLTEQEICRRMGVGRTFISGCRFRGKMTTSAFHALRGVVSEMTSPSQPILPVQIKIGIELTQAECELVYVMSTFCKEQLPSRKEEINILQKKIAKKLSE